MPRSTTAADPLPFSFCRSCRMMSLYLHRHTSQACKAETYFRKVSLLTSPGASNTILAQRFSPRVFQFPFESTDPSLCDARSSSAWAVPCCSWARRTSYCSALRSGTSCSVSRAIAWRKGPPASELSPLREESSSRPSSESSAPSRSSPSCCSCSLCYSTCCFTSSNVCARPSPMICS